jgi:hypothetical protein
MLGTALSVWHPTLWSWIDTVLPALMAVGGFATVLRALNRPGRPNRLRATSGALLTVAGTCWLFLAQPLHGP